MPRVETFSPTNTSTSDFTVLDSVIPLEAIHNNFLTIHSLRSGKILIENADTNRIIFSIYDLSQHIKLASYTHKIISKNDHYNCYLPEGPMLKPYREELEISLTQLFEYRLAVKLPNYYGKLIRPNLKIAYIGNNHFIVLNQSAILMENAIFDLFSMNNAKISYLRELYNNKQKFPNPFFSSFSNYQSNNTQQIFSNGGNFLCVVYKTNYLDVWKCVKADKFVLHATFNVKEKITKYSTFDFHLICLTQTIDDYLICQASVGHNFICLLKINLQNKTLSEISNINHDCINSYVIKFNPIQKMHALKGSNVYIGISYSPSDIYYIDTSTMSIQKIDLPHTLIPGVFTTSGHFIVQNWNTHIIEKISFSYIVEYLCAQKKLVNDSRRSLLINHVYPNELVNLVNQYSEDYYAEHTEKKPAAKTNTSVGCFSYFYKKRDWTDKSAENSIEFKKNPLIQKVLK